MTNATPTELEETWVWDAFRSLRVEGTPVHRAVADYAVTSGFFDTSGATLEIGGGDGHLWDAGGDGLAERARAAGPVTVTDLDPALVARCRADERLRRLGADVCEADLERLPFGDRCFARAFVIHVVHWCRTPLGVTRAMAELARVLAPTARALVVTVDESVHMAELYTLLARARDALLARGERMSLAIPRSSPRVASFCAANASSYLAEAFGDIRRVDCRYAHVVDAIHEELGISADAFVVRYARTLPFLRAGVGAGEVPETFFDELGGLVRAEIADRGSLRFSRCDVIYDVRRPL